MEYSYKKILDQLLSEVPINENDNVYGITFVAGPGFGKSTVANILSKKLGLLSVANDQIRRVYDSLGFDNTCAEPLSCKSFSFALKGVYLTQSLNSTSDG